MENNLFPLVGGSINKHDAIMGIYIQIYGCLICCSKLNAIKLHSGIKNAINNPQV